MPVLNVEFRMQNAEFCLGFRICFVCLLFRKIRLRKK